MRGFHSSLLSPVHRCTNISQIHISKVELNIPNVWEYLVLFLYLYPIGSSKSYTMTELPYTAGNIEIIQKFIRETRDRISNGVNITFTFKASSELEDLMLQYDIDADDIEYSILNLTTENYYRGIDLSGNVDFNVCAFRAFVGKDNVEIFLKYGLEVDGLQILIFSNHIPDYPMKQSFKK